MQRSRGKDSERSRALLGLWADETVLGVERRSGRQLRLVDPGPEGDSRLMWLIDHAMCAHDATVAATIV